MYDANGVPKSLKFGAKIRVFNFGLVYYGNIRDILIDCGGAIWIQGSYAKDTDDRVTYGDFSVCLTETVAELKVVSVLPLLSRFAGLRRVGTT